MAQLYGARLLDRSTQVRENRTHAATYHILKEDGYPHCWATQTTKELPASLSWHICQGHELPQNDDNFEICHNCTRTVMGAKKKAALKNGRQSGNRVSVGSSKKP